MSAVIPATNAEYSGDLESYRGFFNRVISSRQFARAGRQRAFLLYLWERQLKNPAADIHEQEIGVAVFGRREGYETAIDNIVRVNASELRKRLETYFSEEGASEPLALEIPKGNYRLVFRPRFAVESACDQAPAQHHFRISRSLLPWSLIVLLAIACILLTIRALPLSAAADGLHGSLGTLWGQMIRNGHGPDFVVADSCLSLFEDLSAKSVGLQAYVDRSYLLRLDDPTIPAERRETLRTLMNRRYMSIADEHLLQKFRLLFPPRSITMPVFFARDYPAERLKGADVVLFGSKRSNPWIELFESELNFVPEFDTRAYILNRKPRAGEAAVYEPKDNSPNTPVTYGILAFIRNENGPGNVLILAGNDMRGTEAAGEAISDRSSFEKLQRKLGVPVGRAMPHFEAVLRAGVAGGSVAGFEILASRIYATH